MTSAGLPAAVTSRPGSPLTSTWWMPMLAHSSAAANVTSAALPALS
jgi:hypothetical protein